MAQCQLEGCTNMFTPAKEGQKYCCTKHGNKAWCMNNKDRIRVRKNRTCEFEGCSGKVEDTTSSKFCPVHRDRLVRIPPKTKEYVPPAPKYSKGSGVYNLPTEETLSQKDQARIDRIVKASQQPGYNKHHPERSFDANE